MGGGRSVGIYSNEDAKKKAFRRTVIFVIICLASVRSQVINVV